MAGIYNHKGEWIEFGEARRDILNEVATAAAVGDTTLGGMMASFPDPDPVLRKRGDDAQVLEDLTADDQVCSAMQARKLRVLNKSDYDFKPGLLPGKKASPAAVKLTEELTADLEDIDLRTVFSSILDAPFFGLAFLELMWEVQGSSYRLVGIKDKPRNWFTFDEQGRPCLKPSSGTPQPLSSHKFLIPRHFPTTANPYGLRLLSRCLWPVAFKRGGVQFYVRFLERYGMPWTLGKAPQGTDKAQMARDLAAMVQDAVAVIPLDAKVDLIEHKGSAGNTHERFLQRWDKAISKVLMGQTLTAEMDGQGSRAAAQTHLDVAEGMAEADQFLVTATMCQLAAIYRDINASGVEAPVFEFHEPEDHEAQADLDGKLYNMGVRFTPGHFERRYGLQPDEFTLDRASSIDKEGGGDDAGGKFAEPGPDHQAQLDALIEAALPGAARRNEAFVRELTATLQKADSWEDLQILLAEHLGREMEPDAQEDLLAELLTTAALLGNASAADESDAG